MEEILERWIIHRLRFYRDKGGSGILTPQGENGICIYVDRDGALTNDHEFVCTAGEYDSGKVIIKTRTGKNVNV